MAQTLARIFPLIVMSLAFVSRAILYGADALTPLEVGVIEFMPIASYENAGAEGPLVDYANGVFADAGFTPHYQEVSINRSLEQLKNHRLDLVLSLFRTPERAAYINYSSEPVLHTGTGFCTLIPIEKKPITRRTRLAHVRGTILPLPLQKLSLFPVIGEKAQIRMLQMMQKNRVDAAFSPKPEIISYTARQTGVKDQLYCYELKNTQTPIYFGYSRGLSADLVQRLNSSLEKRLKLESFDNYFRRVIEKAGFATPEIRIFDPDEIR